MKKKINEKMSIGEILNLCPEAGEIMAECGLGCIGCPMAQMESLEEGASAHGASGEEIRAMVEKINEKLKSK